MKKIIFYFSLLFFSFSFSSYSQTYVISGVAGNTVQSYSGDGGSATAAEINFPQNVFIKSSTGFVNIYIADAFNERVRLVDNSGVISTVAGNGVTGFSGDGGPATAAEFYWVYGITVDDSGKIYIGDWLNSRIRMVNTSGIISTIAGNGSRGYSGDGGPATAAEFNQASGLFVTGSGNLYITDDGNNRVRMVNTNGIITTIAGNGTGGYYGDGGNATAAQINWPSEVMLDTSGNVFISDEFNNRIRMINTSGIISTVIGNGVYGFSGDGGHGKSAELAWPSGIAMDDSGNMYVADYKNNRIRKMNTSGIINTIAGTGTAAFYGNGGPALSAELNGPIGAQVDKFGNVYFPDLNNNCIRKLSPNYIETSNQELKVESEKLNVYPNPFSNSTTISIDNPLTANHYLELYDLTGQKLKQIEFSGNTYSLSAEGLAKGMYFIRVLDREHNVIGTMKIVVQ